MTRLPERYRAVIEGMIPRPLPAVADGLRAVYRPLRAWGERLTGRIVSMEAAPLPVGLPGAKGAEVGVAAWTGRVAGDRGTFERLRDLQRTDGSFLVPTAADNLESLWYHELIVLHAFASYALECGDEGMLEGVRRAGLYHLNETQPDHATTEPWGINAFLLQEETYPLADQQLHAMRTQRPEGIDAVSAILLVDTLAGYGVPPRTPISSS
jgi:hypothetical protein